MRPQGQLLALGRLGLVGLVALAGCRGKTPPTSGSSTSAQGQTSAVEEAAQSAADAEQDPATRRFPSYRPGLRLADLVRLTWLMYPQAGVEKQVSSYDRQGGNDDGFEGTYSYLRRDERGEYVIMESDQAGVINQIWLTWDSEDGLEGRLRFYFDGEDKPRVDLPVVDFFAGEHFPFLAPFVVDMKSSSGGANCHLPMPYRSSVRVTTTEPIFFYHIDYRIYGTGQGIETFDPQALAQDREEYDAVLSYLGSGAFAPELSDPEGQTSTLTPGREQLMLEASGEGSIQGLVLRLDEDASPRDIILRIYYEEMQAPSVAVSVGDLFGQTFSERPIRAVPLGWSDDGYYLNFPIPFQRHVRVTLENVGPTPVEATLSAGVRRRSLPEGFVYFHAQWFRDTTRIAVPYTYLSTSGRGHFCGVYCPMQGLLDLSYLEGDERIYVDGEGIPSFHGTGTEDYYLGGWYFEEGEFDQPYHGLSFKRRDAGRVSPYRFQIVDSIPFEHNIRVEIEHGSLNDYPGASYGHVSFWYQDPPVGARALSKNELAFPRLEANDRIAAIYAATVFDRESSSSEASVRMWSDLDVEWSGKAQVFLPDKGKLVLEIPIEVEDSYQVIPFLGRGPDHGNVVLEIGGQTATFAGYSKELRVNEEGPTILVTLQPPAARLVSTVSDKDPQSEGYAQGLDKLWIRPVGGVFVEDWLVIGPFDNENDEGLDRTMPPEREFSRAARYEGKNGKEVRWQSQPADHRGHVDLVRGASEELAEWSVSYARTAVYSDSDRPVYVLLGSDSGIRVWLNGVLGFGRHQHRQAMPDRYLLKAPLRQGWNQFLVKVDNGDGETGFYFRITNYPGLKWDTARVE